MLITFITFSNPVIRAFNQDYVAVNLQFILFVWKLFSIDSKMELQIFIQFYLIYVNKLNGIILQDIR